MKISAKDMTTIRTCDQYDRNVYFFFKGSLYKDDNRSITLLSEFKGFNCAQRKSDIEVHSWEYVEFENDAIDPIYNKEVNFEMGAVDGLLAPDGHINILLPIPVNRNGYRAIEQFDFTVINGDYPLGSEVSLAWSRYSEPRLEVQKALGYRWFYAGHGYKTFYPPVDEFPGIEF